MYVFKKSRVYKMQRNVWNLVFSGDKKFIVMHESFAAATL